jgi:hypothetical protein
MFEAPALIAEKGCDRFPPSGRHGAQLVLTEEDRHLPALKAAFRRILRSGRAGTVLHLMNDLDLLGWFIPPFGDLVSFFQHNVYHYFTADEHTLIAITNAERLAAEKGPLGETFRRLPKREIIVLAIHCTILRNHWVLLITKSRALQWRDRFSKNSGCLSTVPPSAFWSAITS